MGLIHVMQNLADPEKLGSGIATAYRRQPSKRRRSRQPFPAALANKLKSLVRREVQFASSWIEGIVAIREARTPRNIEAKLQGFLH